MAAYQGGVHSVGVCFVIILLCVTNITSNIHGNNEPKLFQEWIEKGHQRDANLCGACIRPINKRSLVRGGGGYNQASSVYIVKGCGGWVFARVNGVGWVVVEGRAVLSDDWDKPRCANRTGSLQPK